MVVLVVLLMVRLIGPRRVMERRRRREELGIRWSRLVAVCTTFVFPEYSKHDVTLSQQQQSLTEHCLHSQTATLSVCVQGVVHRISRDYPAAF